MLRSSRVLSGESYRHPLAKARAQEVLSARLSQRAPDATDVPIPPRHWISESSGSSSVRSSARIAAQRTVSTYMADGSVVRIPKGLPATVTVRSYAVSNDHLTTLHDLLDATREPDIGAETKQRRIYDSYRYVEQHGHHFLSQHAVGSPTALASLRSIIVDKAREIRSQMSKCVLRGAERRRFLGVLQRVEELFGDN
jgi:hypothetical protein